MRQLLKGAVELTQTLIITLLITSILLLCVEAIWEGRVIPYLNLEYLLITTVIFGALALWLYREKIDPKTESKGEEPGETRRKKKFDGKTFPTVRIPVARWLISRMYREDWRYPLLLLLILLACFGIRYYFASIGNIYSDEGNGLYDANLILQGEIPFRDYITREPGYMYTLALFIKIFGYSIMTGRLIAIIASVVICFFIFKIGKELYNKNVGLVAALIYALSPFFIYWDTIGYLRTASLVWIPIAVYFLILAIKRNDIKYYFLNGLFIGIAMLFYRGHLVYLIVCPLSLLFIHPREFKDLIRNTATVLLGFCLPVVPTLAYFVLQTDILWMLSQYVPPAFITSVEVTGTGGEPSMSYPLAKSRVLYCLFRNALYLFIPTLVFLTMVFRKSFREQRQYISFVILVWALILSLVIKGKFVEYYSWDLAKMPTEYVPVFFGFLVSIILVSILLLTAGKLSFSLKLNFNFANIFLILWFFCASIYFIISPVRSEIGAIPATIMAAIAILMILQQPKGRILRIASTLFLILLTLSMVFAVFVYVNTPNPLKELKMSVANDVGYYINEHSSPEDEILTGTPIFAVEADRRIIFDISHPLIYVSNADDPMAKYDTYDTTPSISEILSYLEQHQIKYIIADLRTNLLFISDRHPDLRDYILENYTVEKSVDNVDIYGRNK